MCLSRTHHFGWEPQNEFKMIGKSFWNESTHIFYWTSIFSSSLSFHFPQSHNASVALLPNNWCDLPSAHSISFHLFLFALSLALAELWCWLWLTKINCSRSHLFGCVYVRKMENRSLCRLLSEDSQMIFSCSGIYIYIYIAWISNGCIFGWVYRTTIHTELYLYRTHHCERVRMNFELKSGRSLGVLCF